MNKPIKSKKTEKLLNSFLHFQFKKHFYRIHLDDRLLNLEDGPKIYTINHSNWWDGLLIFYLNQKIFKGDSYAMMSKKGIEDFPFFGKIGAFAVDPDSPKSLIRSLQLSQSILEEGKSVWIFPQGAEEHLEKRPFTYLNGPAYLLEKNVNTRLIPIAAYYTYRHDQRPELFIRVGETINPSILKELNRKEITSFLRVSHEELLNSVRNDVIEEKLSSFTTFKTGSKTSSEWLQWIKNPFNKRSI